jgi:peptidoglycan/xylan/chitin deacetylase (PgdA/CDA1 family)
MATSADAPDLSLLRANTPAALWKVVDDSVTPEQWDDAARAALAGLEGLPAAGAPDPAPPIALILGEGQFGPGHWRLPATRRLYYRVRPFLPAPARARLRTAFLGRSDEPPPSPLRWPVEDRYVAFQRRTMRELLRITGASSLPHLSFWPDGNTTALVLTHDVEEAAGQAFVREVAALEESHGVRSSFNFVPELYELDHGLMEELRERGFEVGVHGLTHDGRTFSSRRRFRAEAPRINAYLRRWGAPGFRSPMTHRHPEWMQDLDMEYDLSFFDTDPFEPIGGGTMSIWPFSIGRFLELPYTLVQDHTLMVTRGETTPRLWLEKLEFVARNHGMALLNSHPDYLREPRHLDVYDEFVRVAAARPRTWNALPADVARWWRARASASATRSGGAWEIDGPEGATIASVVPAGDDDVALEPVATP